jgi:DNA-binding response OmpR family regulator
MIDRVETSGQVPARGRILVIEDDPDAAIFAVHVLTTRGQFDVTHTADPAVALRLAMTRPWDLVLTDADLPGITCLDLLHALRRVAPETPIVILTAQPYDAPAVAALRQLADEFLEKPAPIAKLLATVTDLVRSPNLAGKSMLRGRKVYVSDSFSSAWHGSSV